MKAAPIRRSLLALAAALSMPPVSSPAQTASPPPPLAGIAHVALRVHDLAASIAFYGKLGFEQAFDLSRDGKAYESFIKINDRQFLELYPVSPGAKPSESQIGFLHLCFEGADLNAIHDDYVARGLTPISVRKAGAGNLLFTLAGPAQPSFPQNIEYTQYQPGSLHSNNTGQHLGPDRIGDRLISVTLAMKDPAAATAFYLTQLRFTSDPHNPALLHLPGDAAGTVEIAPATLGDKARLTFHSANLKMAAQRLRQQAVPVAAESKRSLSVNDPDGNILIFTQP